MISYLAVHIYLLYHLLPLSNTQNSFQIKYLIISVLNKILVFKIIIHSFKKNTNQLKVLAPIRPWIAAFWRQLFCVFDVLTF